MRVLKVTLSMERDRKKKAFHHCARAWQPDGKGKFVFVENPDPEVSAKLRLVCAECRTFPGLENVQECIDSNRKRVEEYNLKR